ncbi:MAG: response regulator transcription factor [Pseudomonadota bacterium]
MTDHLVCPVLLVEDEPNALERCRQIVASHPRLKLLDTASSLSEARDKLSLHGEEVALLLTDWQLGDGDASELIRTCKDAYDARSMVITVFGDVTSVLRAIEAGADGYLLKSGTDYEMQSAISTVLDGGAPISAAVAVHLLKRLRKPAAVDAAASLSEGDIRPQLSDREIEVLSDLARGLSYKEVARRLNISHYTVGDHVKAIYRKLEVKSRGEAVFEAVQGGLIKIDPSE